jgi:hypothetical protein
MRYEESCAIKSMLSDYQLRVGRPFAHVINLGSGDVDKLKNDKPWVFENVFLPLKISGANIIHSDFKNFGGVTHVCDLRLPEALSFTKDMHGPKLFILANVLEHVPKTARNNILNKIFSAMKKDDGLLVTVPNQYPYHPDPIDTLYRPSPQDLYGLIKLNWIEGKVIAAGSYREEFLNMKTLKKIRKILKIFFPFQSPKEYLNNLHRFLYLFKKYKVTLVFGVQS